MEHWHINGKWWTIYWRSILPMVSQRSLTLTFLSESGAPVSGQWSIHGLSDYRFIISAVVQRFQPERKFVENSVQSFRQIRVSYWSEHNSASPQVKARHTQLISSIQLSTPPLSLQVSEICNGGLSGPDLPTTSWTSSRLWPYLCDWLHQLQNRQMTASPAYHREVSKGLWFIIVRLNDYLSDGPTVEHVKIKSRSTLRSIPILKADTFTWMNNYKVHNGMRRRASKGPVREHRMIALRFGLPNGSQKNRRNPFEGLFDSPCST